MASSHVLRAAVLLLPPALLAPVRPAAAQDGLPVADHAARIERLEEADARFDVLGAEVFKFANHRNAEAADFLRGWVDTWRGRQQIVAVQALGLCRCTRASEHLQELLDESKVREVKLRAVDALAESGADGIRILRERLRKERNEAVRARILDQLIDRKVSDLEKEILRAARDKNLDLRLAGMRGISEYALEDGLKPALRALGDGNQLVRRAAVDAVAALGGEKAYEALLETLEDSKNPELRAAIALALRQAHRKEEVEVLTKFGSRQRDEEVLAAITRAIADAAEHQPEAVAPILSKLLEHDDPRVRRSAVLGLAHARPDGVLELLAERLDDGDARTRVHALWALSRIGAVPESAMERVLGFARSESGSMRVNAIRALGAAGTDAAFRAVEEALGDPNWSVRLAAVEALERMRQTRVLEPLILTLERETDRVQDDIAEGLARLTGVDFGNNAVSWKSWWQQLPGDYELPGPEEAAASLSEGRARQASEQQTGYHGIPIPSGGLVFILDISGSMNEVNEEHGVKTHFEYFAERLFETLGRLPSSSKFTVVLFSSRAQPWRPELQEASERAVAAAREHLDHTTPWGGTDTYDALQVAMEIPGAQTIFLLTDGKPTVGLTSTDEIRRLVRERNRDLRIVIHTIAAGEDATEFLADLAAENGGVAVDLRDPSLRGG